MPVRCLNLPDLCQPLPRARRVRRRCLLAAVALAGLGASVFGQSSHTWNGGGDPDTSWSTAANWVGGSVPDGNDIINFAGTTNLNPFNNLIGLAGYRIFFNSGAGAFTLDGNAMVMFDFGGNAPKIENNSTSHQTINIAITMNPGFGPGFSEINPVQGDMTFGSPLVLQGGTQLRIFGDNGKTVTFNGAISGTSSTVAINQNSNVVYATANTYSGETFVNAGELRFASGGSAASSSFFRLGDTSGSATASIAMTHAAGGQTITNNINVRAGSSGIKTLRSGNTAGTNTYSGNIFMDADLRVSKDSAGGLLVLSGAVLDLKNQTMTLTGSGDIGVSGTLQNSTGSGKLIKSGSGVATLTAVNTHTGSTTINGGVLSIAADNRLGTAPGAATDGHVTFGGGTLQATSSFTLNINRNTQFNAGGGTFDVATGQTLTVAGIQKGTGGYNKTGAGTLILTNAGSTVTGPVSVTGGVLQISTSAQIGGTGVGAGNITLDSGTFRNASTGAAVTWLTGNRGIVIGSGGGTIDVGGTDTTIHIYTSGSIVGPGNTLTKTGGGTFRNTTPTSITFSKLVVTGGLYQAAADNIFGAVPGTFTADAITLDGGGISVNAGFPFHANRGVTIGAGNGTFSGTSNGTLQAAITGTGGLTKALSGALTLAGNNDFAGGLNVLGGTVHLNHDNAAGTGTITVTPASAVTIRNSVAATTVPNKIVLNTGTSPTLDFFAAAGQILTLDGVISGAANWTRGNGGGTGTVGLTNSGNSFSGNLTVAQGILAITANNALGSAAGVTTINSGASLVMRGGFNYTTAEPLTVGGNGSTASNGAINNAADTNSFAGPITLSASTRINAAASSQLTLGGVITDGAGTLNLEKTGPGTLVLTNANTYDGMTTLNGGTLRITNTTGSATGTGSVLVSATATLAGTGIITGDVTINGSGTLSPGNSVGEITVGSVDFKPASTYLVDLNFTDSGPSTADKLITTDASATVKLGDGVNHPNLQFVAVRAGAPSGEPYRFVLIDAAGTNKVAAGEQFAGKPEGVLLAEGFLKYTIYYRDNPWGVGDANDVVIEVSEIPEPASVFAVAAGGLLLVRRRRA